MLLNHIIVAQLVKMEGRQGLVVPSFISSNQKRSSFIYLFLL